MYLIHDFLDTAAYERPDKNALITEEHKITFSLLKKYTLSVSNWLIEKNITKGDRVILLLPNSLETVTLIFALSRVGAIFVILNYDITKFQIPHILGDSDPKLLITNRDRAQDVNGILKEKKIILIEHHWDQMKNDLVLTKPMNVNPDDLACLIYTSGSTGKPKAIMSTHNNIIFVTKAIQERIQMNENDVIGNFLPLSFDYGLYQIFLCALSKASLALGNEKFAGPSLINKLVEWGVTGFPVVPNLALNFILLSKRGTTNLPNIRFITNTGAALPLSYIQQLESLLPSCNIFLMYGLTECKRVSILEPHELNEKYNSVGKPLGMTNCYIVDKEGQTLLPGQIGELVVKGSHVMVGYWGDTELTISKFRLDENGNRLLFTGDLFSMDEEGYLYYQGRNDDLFKRKGFRVSALEIEIAALGIDKITQASLVVTSDETVLFLVTSLSVSVIMEKLKERLEEYKLPDKIILLKEMPTTSNGKNDKKYLAKLLLEKGNV